MRQVLPVCGKTWNVHGKSTHVQFPKSMRKGTMFFLPLPLNKTLDTLEEVKHSDTANDLPDPELYVIVNGKPTKAEVVWHSLVNIDDVKAAVSQLREINWLYQNVDESLVDDAVKKVIEVVNSAK